MNIYLIEQNVVNGYDTYDKAIVFAPSAKAAKLMHPGGGAITLNRCRAFNTWTDDPKNVIATLIGKAKKGVGSGVALASFNAG